MLALYADRLAINLAKVLALRPDLTEALKIETVQKSLAALREVATDSPGDGAPAQAAKANAAGDVALKALWALQGRALQALAKAWRRGRNEMADLLLESDSMRLGLSKTLRSVGQAVSTMQRLQASSGKNG